MAISCSCVAKYILFYVTFYTALLAYFGAMLLIFYQTLDAKVPKLQQGSSLIGTNPGLGFRPMPPAFYVESALIWYKANSYKYWIDEIGTFLQVYKERNPKLDELRVQCSYQYGPPEGKVCDVDISSWGPCLSEQNYNYHKSAPCIFLKLNKIFGWKPIVYNASEELPERMPKNLKDHIENQLKYNKLTYNTVWVDCEGEKHADVENMGPILYYPGRGFPGYYFPFKNIDGYLSPLVAVQFQKPKRGVIINIECKAWARNIQHDRVDQRGSVYFKQLVD